jgi:hypothetical protein
MAEFDDLFNAVQDVNTHLQQLITNSDVTNTRLSDLHNDIGQLRASVDGGLGRVSQQLQQVIALQSYANQALFQNAQQNDTLICILEHVSRNTCALLNEAHDQTELQTAIRRDVGMLVDMYRTEHAGAALDFDRRALLQKQIEECCPPPPRQPVCTYEPCKAPAPLPAPPINQVPQPPR